MKNIFFNDEVLPAEKKVISSLKIPSAVLMENAGANSANYILKNYPDEIKNEVVILSGKGNNAGDGFVTARHLINENVKVKVALLYNKKEIKDDALINYNVLENLKSEFLKIVFCKSEKELRKEISKDNRIIIDAIFGVGFKGEPDDRLKKIISLINKLKDKTVIAIDTPSCLSDFSQKSNCISANVTLSMGVKKFHSLFYNGKEHSGKSELVNIGISGNEFDKFNSKNIFETELNDVKDFLPHRKPDSNKYSNGKVFILSGSRGLTGATYLCSMSALKAGSGAVITGIPKSLNDIMEVKMTEIMTIPLAETDSSTLSMYAYDDICNKIKWADAVLIGPGISKNEETCELVRTIVKENDSNFIIDADATFAFRNNLNLFKHKNIILTPHFGEFSKLISVNSEEIKKDFYNYAVEFAKKYNVVLVLKNSPTIVTEGKGFYVNSTGRENLATAGSGDVLSGIIASLCSQSDDLLQSAISGSFIHGMCGDNLYDSNGNNSTIASDLINEIPEVINFIRKN